MLRQASCSPNSIQEMHFLLTSSLTETDPLLSPFHYYLTLTSFPSHPNRLPLGQALGQDLQVVFLKFHRHADKERLQLLFSLPFLPYHHTVEPARRKCLWSQRSHQQGPPATSFFQQGGPASSPCSRNTNNDFQKKTKKLLPMQKLQYHSVSDPLIMQFCSLLLRVTVCS